MKATLSAAWVCLGRRVGGKVQPCDAHGEGERADTDAAEHTAATNHTTSTRIRVEKR